MIKYNCYFLRNKLDLRSRFAREYMHRFISFHSFSFDDEPMQSTGGESDSYKHCTSNNKMHEMMQTFSRIVVIKVIEEI